MTSEWADHSLGELCGLCAGSVFKPHLQGNAAGAFPFIKVSDMNLPANAICIREANNWVSHDDLRELKAKLFPPGTVVFAKIGEALRQNRLRQLVQETLIDNNMMGAIPRVDRIDPRFFYYTLTQFEFSDIAQGTALPYLTVSALSDLRVKMPALPEQRAIAYILGTLDEKIELNQRINETLEAMARSIFKSWFVDFDPVRAKAEGRDPGLPKHIADLFPDSFEDSQLGETPKGWPVASLPEVIDVNPPRTLGKGDIAPYLDMANMPIRGHSPDVVIKRPFSSGMRFANGDTLVARITPCLENGKTAYVDFLEEGQIGWGSTEYIVLRPKAPIPTEYAYCIARSDGLRDFAVQNMSGSSGRQRVPAEALSQFLIVSPPDTVMALFGKLIRPLFAHANVATAENRTLANLRDTLLPKLISGELRVSDHLRAEFT